MPDRKPPLSSFQFRLVSFTDQPTRSPADRSLLMTAVAAAFDVVTPAPGA